MSDRPHILIIGASGRFLAQSAFKAGHSVSVLDLFGDVDTRQICLDSEQFLPFEESAVKTRRIESLYSLVYNSGSGVDEKKNLTPEFGAGSPHSIVFSGGAENFPEFFSRDFFPYCRVAGPPEASIKRLLCLRTIESACEQHRIRFPTTCGSLKQPLDMAKVWLRKRIRSGGGLQTQKWRGAESVDVKLIDFSSGEYLQEKIVGETLSGCFVATTGEASLLGACAQHSNPNNDDFLYRGSAGPIPLFPELYHEMLRVGEIIAREFQLVGVFGIDFVMADGDLFLVDINPRVPASAELIERFQRLTMPSFTIVRVHLDACFEGRLPTPKRIFGQSIFSKRVVYLESNQPLKVSAAFVDYLQSNSHITDIPQPGTEIQPGHPIVTVHAQAEDIRSLKKESSKRVQEFKRALSSFGTIT